MGPRGSIQWGSWPRCVCRGKAYGGAEARTQGPWGQAAVRWSLSSLPNPNLRAAWRANQKALFYRTHNAKTPNYTYFRWSFHLQTVERQSGEKFHIQTPLPRPK